MTRDELETILAAKERQMGLAGTRRGHFHACCEISCGIPESCEDRHCTETPSGKQVPCTMSGTARERAQERRNEMHTQPGRT